MSTLGTRRTVGLLALLLACLLAAGVIERADFSTLFSALLGLLK